MERRSTPKFKLLCVQERRISRLDMIALLAPAAFLMLIVLYAQWDRMITARNDFVHFYIGGLLFGTADLHSPEANAAFQKQLLGVVLAHSYFVRPTFYGLFLKPLTFLSYRSAYWVFQGISILCFAVFLWLQKKRLPELPILACFSFPLLSAFINGQDVPLLLLFCSASILLSRKGFDLPAGMVLALCAIKAHLFILVPFAAIFHRRYRIIAGGVLGGLFLSAVELAGGGIRTQAKLLEILRMPSSSPYPDIMPNLRSITGDNHQLFVAGAVLCIVLTTWLMRRAPDYEASLGWALVGGLLVSFHAYLHDCLLLLLAYSLIYQQHGPWYLKAIFRVLALPFVYVALLLGAPFSSGVAIAVIVCLVLGIVSTYQPIGSAAAGHSSVR